MLIEELIRLGRPVLESELDPREVLRLISDAADVRVKNFYCHVIVVELPPEGADGEPVVLDVQNWQTSQALSGSRKAEIEVDVQRALGAPISLPAGGNPVHPQGKYGLPVYPVYDPHFEAFRTGESGVCDFLAGRVARTPGFVLDDSMRERVAAILHLFIAERYDGAEKWLGVLVLARCGPNEFFDYGERPSLTSVGQSVRKAGYSIEPNCQRIVEAAWAAKLEEGAGMGRRTGSCTISGEGEAVVAA